ncbi:hypothetical protein TcasGA2_TC034759 [Tribolium castaneum]|uniref:Uncharacterized protein n=1 Tax=Tribolium castaneum TaxID=7070 RepID=A0A139WFW9_TRICA|nr:hypothetical protein TcasGA2_TC034759 [Tribolium castaneum]
MKILKLLQLFKNLKPCAGYTTKKKYVETRIQNKLTNLQLIRLNN